MKNLEKFQNWTRNSISLKLIVIGILVLLLLIPSSMIKNLIHEREKRRDETVNEVSSKWGFSQTICGPVLTIPYRTYEVTKEKTIVHKHFAHILPDSLNFSGNLNSETRYRGIYKVVVYTVLIDVSGNFDNIAFDRLGVNENEILWYEAFLTIGIPDMRGINKNINIEWNSSELDISPGVKSKDIVTSGLTASVRVRPGEKYKFSFQLDLNGSNSLYFVPLGEETVVNLASDWDNPSFDGAFLPDERNINVNGFSAYWNILHLNRNYPQKWSDNNYDVNNSGFGVKLIFPVDMYQQSMRSVKYSILFIMLTFIALFFSEIINKKRIHVVQYILVGSALCVFYSLLIALSEHISFNLSYLISSIANIALITAFSYSIFKNRIIGSVIFMELILLYIFLFTVLQLSNYALLLGNIGLFVVIAIVMFFSRKIDWYTKTEF